MEFFWLQRR